MYRGNFDIVTANEMVISEKEITMSLAGGLLFMIWCSIVFFSIGAWVVMTITKQDKSIYDSWDMDDDKDFHDEVG